MLLRAVLCCVAVHCVRSIERVEDGSVPAAMAQRLRLHRDDHHIDGVAIAGSVKEADMMGQLPQEEAKKRLIALAKKMDINKDGKVSEDELVQWITKAIMSIDEEESEERFKDNDANNDGMVSWQEFVADAFPGEDVEKLHPQDKKLLEEDFEFFQVADLDHDGFLTRDEFKAFQTPENYPHMHEVLVRVTTKEKDLNGDGAIQPNEFLGELMDNPASEWHQVELDHFHNKFDTDKDGKLTGLEIVRWMIPEQGEDAVNEVRHVLSIADKDGDGALSYEEIANQYELLRKSEVTGFGSHLNDLKHEEL